MDRDAKVAALGRLARLERQHGVRVIAAHELDGRVQALAVYPAQHYYRFRFKGEIAAGDVKVLEARLFFKAESSPYWILKAATLMEGENLLPQENFSERMLAIYSSHSGTPVLKAALGDLDTLLTYTGQQAASFLPVWRDMLPKLRQVFALSSTGTFKPAAEVCAQAPFLATPPEDVADDGPYRRGLEQLSELFARPRVPAVRRRTLACLGNEIEELFVATAQAAFGRPSAVEQARTALLALPVGSPLPLPAATAPAALPQGPGRIEAEAISLHEEDEFIL